MSNSPTTSVAERLSDLMDDLYISTHGGKVPVAVMGSDDEPDVLDFLAAKAALLQLLADERVAAQIDEVQMARDLIPKMPAIPLVGTLAGLTKENEYFKKRLVELRNQQQ